jgi:hypothetical protein
MRTSFAALLLLAGCSATSDFDYSFRPVAARDGGGDSAPPDAAPELDAHTVQDAEAGVERDTAIPMPPPDAGQGDAGCSGASCCELAEVNELTCEGGRDEDCDGKVDCADSDCRQATVCCPAPTPESGDVACTDKVDNDCDGLLDCAEQGCKGVYECSCTRTGPEDMTRLASCADQNDNDCDRLIDCAENDCAFSSACCAKTAGQELVETSCTDGINNDCDTEGADCADPDCRMSSDAGATGDESALCTDGLDNDCDGRKDCDDRDCRNQLVCCVATPGQERVETACGDGANNDCDSEGGDCFDSDCALDPSCCRPITGGESTLKLCANGRDDDCDGLVDCADPQCGFILECCVEYLRANGQKQQATETSCIDKYDNDCDGLLNCKDDDCSGLKTCGIIITPPATQ